MQVDQNAARRRAMVRTGRPWSALGWAAKVRTVACCWGIAGGVLHVQGCAAIATNPQVEPTRFSVVREQLVVHSNFELPARHRLLDELAAQRGDLLTALDLPPSDESIHVYLFDSEEVYQSYVKRLYPPFADRRAFFMQTDTRLLVFAHWGDRLAEDLRHEVAHGYLHSVVPKIPLWLDEGLAETAEVPRADAGLNPPHLQLLLAQWVGGTWRPNLERLEQILAAEQLSQVDYAEAWAWAHWLLANPERREILTAYLVELRREPQAMPLSARIRHVAGAPEQALVAHLYALAPERSSRSQRP